MNPLKNAGEQGSRGESVKGRIAPALTCSLSHLLTFSVILLLTGSAAFAAGPPVIGIYSNGVFKGNATSLAFSNPTAVSVRGGRALVNPGGGAGGIASNAIDTAAGKGTNSELYTVRARTIGTNDPWRVIDANGNVVASITTNLTLRLGTNGMTNSSRLYTIAFPYGGRDKYGSNYSAGPEIVSSVYAWEEGGVLYHDLTLALGLNTTGADLNQPMSILGLEGNYASRGESWHRISGINRSKNSQPWGFSYDPTNSTVTSYEIASDAFHINDNGGTNRLGFTAAGAMFLRVPNAGSNTWLTLNRGGTMLAANFEYPMLNVVNTGSDSAPTVRWTNHLDATGKPGLVVQVNPYEGPAIAFESLSYPADYALRLKSVLGSEGVYWTFIMTNVVGNWYDNFFTFHNGRVGIGTVQPLAKHHTSNSVASHVTMRLDSIGTNFLFEAYAGLTRVASLTTNGGLSANIFIAPAGNTTSNIDWAVRDVFTNQIAAGVDHLGILFSNAAPNRSIQIWFQNDNVATNVSITFPGTVQGMDRTITAWSNSLTGVAFYTVNGKTNGAVITGTPYVPLTNDMVTGLPYFARHRCSVTVDGYGTATLSAGVMVSLVISNGANGRLAAKNFSITSGVLAVDTRTNQLVWPDVPAGSHYWLTNGSVVPNTTEDALR